MLQRMKTLAAREDGFTLVELMVVVAILAVLLLMSLSTFAGVKARAQDSAAKQGAAKAMETGRIVFTDQATYATADTATLAAAEPGMQFADAAVGSDDPNVASTDVPDASTTGTPSWRRCTAMRGTASSSATGSRSGSATRCSVMPLPATAPRGTLRR